VALPFQDRPGCGADPARFPADALADLPQLLEASGVDLVDLFVTESR